MADPTPTPQVDTSALTKTEVPTSHGMMWSIASPAGGQLALVRHEDAAELVLAALAGYTPPAPPEEPQDPAYMSVEDMAKKSPPSQSVSAVEPATQSTEQPAA